MNKMKKKYIVSFFEKKIVDVENSKYFYSEVSILFYILFFPLNLILLFFDFSFFQISYKKK